MSSSPLVGSTRVSITLFAETRDDLAECMADMAMQRDGFGITISDVVREALARWAGDARKRARVCQVHDADDVVPGRICGRPLPCRDHHK